MFRRALIAAAFASFVPACSAASAEQVTPAESAAHLEASREKSFSGSVVLGGETFQVSVSVTHPENAMGSQRSAFTSSAWVGCTVQNDPYPATVRLRVVSSSNVVVVDEVSQSSARTEDVLFDDVCEQWRTAPHAVDTAPGFISGPLARFTVHGTAYRLGAPGWGVPSNVAVRATVSYTATSEGVFTKRTPEGGGIFEEFVVPAGRASLALDSRIVLGVSKDVQLDETTPLPEVISFEALAQ